MVSHSNLSNELSAPVSMIIAGRDEQREICDHLEQLADNLGGLTDRDACNALLHRLNNDLPLYQQDEEALYEILSTHIQVDTSIVKCVELAKLEHEIHESYLFELSEPLTEISEGRKIRNTDAVGYMFRCFFEGIRRHLSWEDAVLLGDRLNCIANEDATMATMATMLEARLARNRSLLSRHLRLAQTPTLSVAKR